MLDSQGRSFTASVDTSAWVPQDKELFILSNLQPNLPKQLVIFYEIPKDAKGLQLKVGVFDPKLIDLGL